MSNVYRWSQGLAIAIIAVAASAHEARAADSVDYPKQIAPMLKQNCYRCHGPKKQENRLRLDSLAAVLKGGSSGPAVVPKKSGDSPVILAITGDDRYDKMPPKGPPLKPAQIELLRRWIDEGAKPGSTEK